MDDHNWIKSANEEVKVVPKKKPHDDLESDDSTVTLIEKREEFKKYADFRERFNDVFKELDFDDKSSSKNNH